MRILILEDNADRETAMRACIADKFPRFGVEVFAAVDPFVERIKESGLYDVALIALDHDLDLIESERGSLTDPGTGVDAANFLASMPAVVPIIVLSLIHI